MTALIAPQVLSPAVQLFILSRDRTDFCREAVASAVAQTYENCQIIVSDNSENDDVSEMLATEFPLVEVIRRKPALLALEHFNKLIEVAVAPYMVMFHDDDVLEPQYVSRMVELLNLHQQVAAVGCNAKLIKGMRLTQQSVMGDFKGVQLLSESMDLLEPYLSISLSGPAPFPGYMYRTNVIKGLGLVYDEGGKHADVSFLMSVLNRAPILWVDEFLFYYRVHGANDSKQESIANRLNWMRYIHRTTGISPKSITILEGKLIYWARWLQQVTPRFKLYELIVQSKSRRRTIVGRFVFLMVLRLLTTRLDFWFRIFRYIQNRVI